MAKIIAVANQKGGVAKTTTAAALAVGLKAHGYKTLAVDFDPQGNLSDSLGAEVYEAPTIYDVLTHRRGAAETVQHLYEADIIPANIELATAEHEIVQIGKEQRLREVLASIANDYDYIIIDTPPSLGLFTINAFACADELIIPTTADMFAAKGIEHLYNAVKAARKYCNPGLTIKGILFTKYSNRVNVSKDVKIITENLAKHIGAPVFQTVIRNSVRVVEAQTRQQSLFAYDVKSTVSEDYNAFIKEYLNII